MTRSIRFHPKPAQGLAPLKAKHQNDITSTCAQNGSSTGRFFGRKIRPKETSLKENQNNLAATMKRRVATEAPPAEKRTQIEHGKNHRTESKRCCCCQQEFDKTMSTKSITLQPGILSRELCILRESCYSLCCEN
jgi:hypothetical protein